MNRGYPPGVVLTWLLALAVAVSAAGGAAVAAPDTGSDTQATAGTVEHATTAEQVMHGPGEHESLVEQAQNRTGVVELLVWADRTAPADGDGVTESLRASAAASQAPIRAFAADRAGVSVENTLWLANAVLVQVDTDRVPVASLRAIEGVDAVTPNHEIGVPEVARPGDGSADTDTAAGADLTYGLSELNVTPVWDRVGTQGENTTVAVLDTGVDPDHPDIDLAAWAEFDEEGNQVESEPQDYDDNGHGTHVSGTVAGGAASGQHIGVAPETTLHHGAVLTDCQGGCTGTFAQITEGMEWAVQNDADVISMSLGAEGYIDEFIEPVRNAKFAGTTVVAAVGNSGEGTSESPANVYDAVSVGATDQSSAVPAFSSGEQIDTLEAWTAPPPDWPSEYVVPSVSAPGRQVKSTVPGGGYATRSGTSMATPHVAGAAALLQAATTADYSPDEIEAALEAGATKPENSAAPPGERDTRHGSGIVDVLSALIELDGPIAAFSATPASPQPGNETTFDASDTLGNVDSYEWEFTEDGQTDATGETVTHTFQEEGPVNVTLSVTDDTGRTDTEQRSLFVGLAPVVGENPPQDLDGDGLYRDVDGDGVFDIFDVQALFDNLGGDTVQSHTDKFDFDSSGDIDIFDVQRLFDEL
jgi:subtilisin family serine protease